MDLASETQIGPVDSSPGFCFQSQFRSNERVDSLGPD
ncbi:hypothetical protein V22_33740 [Calycomorphotria hydatis]|uniref:Uncharacterized protein n=1 Tax=Calycomorphotria hydatis TaxID=2528027 RepID=A0A517TCL2_9PLAN|nr:hypothetical protein V22_33740 [Calycomorphotria hydatis]